MSTYSKQLLSASVSGRAIPITGTTIPGTIVHISGASPLDEVWLYATNNGASSVTILTLWGGTTVSDLCQVPLAIQNGRTMITDGKLIQGNGTISAYLSTPGTVAVDGFVNRITG